MDHLTKLEEMLNSASLEIKNGKYDAASNILEEMISIDPNFGKAYNHLAFLYDTKFKEYEKAETLYKLCIEKSPLYPAVYYNYAVMLSTLGKYTELSEILDQAINIPGTNKSSIYTEYGIMHEQKGELDKAMDYYKKAGIHSLDKNTVDRAKASIARCQSKKDFF